LNRDVRSAALGRSAGSTYAALVTGGPTLKLQTFAATADGSPSGLNADLGTRAASRPVWLSLPIDGRVDGAVGLIAAGGRLLRFGTGAADPKPIKLSAEIGPVTAVAAAPDGRRVAFIAGGRLFVTVLATGLAPGVTVPQRLRLVPASLSRLSAVDWSSEDSLVVAGFRESSQRVALVDVTVDGALETERLADVGARTVTDLVAHPARPSTAGGAVAVAYVGEGIAYDAFSVAQPIEAAQVVGATVGPKTSRPTAPLFLD
jgi:hypothetical protein